MSLPLRSSYRRPAPRPVAEDTSEDGAAVRAGADGGDDGGGGGGLNLFNLGDLKPKRQRKLPPAERKPLLPWQYGFIPIPRKK